MVRMAQELILLSPEKTVLAFPIAGLASRALAHLLDLMIYGILIAGLMFAMLNFAVSSDIIFATTLFRFLALVILFLYFILFEALWNGQTIGKKAFGLRVRMADGTAVTPVAVIGRNLLRPADFLPTAYFLGLVAMFTNVKSQRLGDLVANTVVLLDRVPQPVFQPAPHVFGQHRFEEHVGDLAGMTIDEYVALKRLCDRFPELSQAAQHQYLREVWEPIAHARRVAPLPSVHPLLLAEAVVMKYGRTHGLL